jgi:hypothetical protein
MVAGRSLPVAATGLARLRERERRRGKERREEEERLRGGLNTLVAPTELVRLSRATCFGTTGAHASHGIWSVSHTTCPSVMPQQSAWLSRASPLGATHINMTPHRATSTQSTSLCHKSHHVHWRDSFISHANRTDTTQWGQILKISFSLIHFSIFFKKGQITKKIGGSGVGFVLLKRRAWRRQNLFCLWATSFLRNKDVNGYPIPGG